MTQNHDDTDAMLNEMMARGRDAQNIAVRTREEQVGAIANEWIDTGMGRDMAYKWSKQMILEAEARGAAEERRKVVGYLFHNPDTGTEYLPYHPVESGECLDAENIRQAMGAELLSELQSAWESWAEDRSEKEVLSANVSGIDVDAVIRNVSELPDRTSPDDQPDLLMVTADELRLILSEAQPANVAAMEARVKELEAENEKFRNAMSKIAAYVGGFASPNCSVDFMTSAIPEEVRLSFAALNREGGE